MVDGLLVTATRLFAVFDNLDINRNSHDGGNEEGSKRENGFHDGMLWECLRKVGGD